MDVDTVARWYEQQGYRVRRRDEGPGATRMHADLIAERNGTVEAVAVSNGPADATRVKNLAAASTEEGAVAVVVGPDDPETQGLCAAYDVRHVPHSVITQSPFLERFTGRPSERKQSGVVDAAFPRIQREPVDEATRPSAWRRWTVVALIWIVALMMIGAFLLRAL